jgi:hypothetical protein
VRATIFPDFCTVPLPVYVVAPQRNEYCPDIESNCIVGPPPSFWMQRLNVDTVNEQLVLLFDVSVAVHVTVVDPEGKQVPDGGTQTTLAPQLSLAAGVG